jgi:hypothetical protein
MNGATVKITSVGIAIDGSMVENVKKKNCDI